MSKTLTLVQKKDCLVKILYFLLICIIMEKNDLHCYLFSTNYVLSLKSCKLTQSQVKIRTSVKSDHPRGVGMERVPWAMPSRPLKASVISLCACFQVLDYFFVGWRCQVFKELFFKGRLRVW